MASAFTPFFTGSTNFYKFTKLPFELRREIWAISLEGQLDRLYQLLLEGSEEDESPYLCLVMRREGYDQATTLTRRFLATCRESRHVTMELLPGTVKVQDKPRSVRGQTVPTRTLRFSGTRDHLEITVASAGARLHEALDSGPCARFAGIKHMSLGLNGFGLVNRMAFRTGLHCPELCEGPECADACQLDLTPKFLRMFPDLSAVYVMGRALEDPDTCSCVAEDGGPVAHDWPTLRTSNPIWSFYVVHEEGICEDFVVPIEVEKWRARYPRVNFPYYRGLPHITFLYLCPVQARIEESLRRRLSIGGGARLD